MENKKNPAKINRRTALKSLAKGAGATAALPVMIPAVGNAASTSHTHSAGRLADPISGSALPPDPALTAADWAPKFLDAHQSATLEAFAETVIPTTDTPGASDAQVHRFLDFLMNEEAEETCRRFVQALSGLDAHCLNRFQTPFIRLSGKKQFEVLSALAEADSRTSSDPAVQHFAHLKGWVVRVFYKSEAGYKALGFEGEYFHSEYPHCPNPDEHKA